MLRSLTIGVAVVAASVLGFVAATGRLTGPEGVDPSITLLLAAVVVVAFLVALLVGRDKPSLDATATVANDADANADGVADDRTSAPAGASADPKVVERALADTGRDSTPSASTAGAGSPTPADRSEPRIQTPAPPTQPVAPARLEADAPVATEDPTVEGPESPSTTPPAASRPLRLRPVGDGVDRNPAAPRRIHGLGLGEEARDASIEPPQAASPPPDASPTDPRQAASTSAIDLDELTEAVTPDHHEATTLDGTTVEAKSDEAPVEAEPDEAPVEPVPAALVEPEAPAVSTAPTPMVSNHPEAIERFKASIVAGQRAAIDDFVARGLLSASGPITDRDVETLVFLAITAQELVAMLENGSYFGADGRTTDEISEARRFAIGG